MVGICADRHWLGNEMAICRVGLIYVQWQGSFCEFGGDWVGMGVGTSKHVLWKSGSFSLPLMNFGTVAY